MQRRLPKGVPVADQGQASFHPNDAQRLHVKELRLDGKHPLTPSVEAVENRFAYDAFFQTFHDDIRLHSGLSKMILINLTFPTFPEHVAPLWSTHLV